jgi:transposase
MGDVRSAAGLIDKLPKAAEVPADTAYDSDKFREFLIARGSSAIIKPKPAEPEPNRQNNSLGRAGKLWMMRRFTSARLFPHQRVQRVRTLCVQAITAYRALHRELAIARDFFAESVKSQAIRD